jgi:uncharacterized protein YqcC (DUF446 family)
MIQTEIIGMADNQKSGRKSWTRLTLYYRPDPQTGRAFGAQVQGWYDEKVSHEQQVYLGSLDLALEFFKESALKHDLSLQADDWWERNEERHVALMGGQPTGLDATRITQIMGWLYQGQEGDMVPMFAKDFALPETSVRGWVLAETEEAEVSPALLPLLRCFKWFDRQAWVLARQNDVPA